MEPHLSFSDAQTSNWEQLIQDIRTHRDTPFFALVQADNNGAIASLMEQFAGQTQQYQHVVLDLTDTQIQSLPAIIEDRLADIIKGDDAPQYLVHLAMAEASFIEEFMEQQSEWVPQLELDRDRLFRGFDMRLLLWCFPYTVKRMQTEAPEFCAALPHSYNLCGASELEDEMEAIEQAARQMHEAPTGANYYTLGEALARMGLIENAMGCMRQVLASEEVDTVLTGKAHQQVGLLLQARQQDAEALDSYKEALSVLPETEEELRTATLDLMADIYRRAGELGQGISLLKQALAGKVSDKTKAGLQRKLAGLLRRKGKLEEAQSLYKQAATTFQTLDMPAEAAEAWQQIAGLLQDILRKPEALEAYKTALPFAQAAEHTFLIEALEDSIELLNEEISPKKTPKKASKGLFGRLFGG